MFEALVGLFIEATVALGRAGFRFYRRLKHRATGRIEILDRPVTSYFANTAEDLETVLRLRRAFFGKRVIVPDEVYFSCWKRNPDTMKIVRDYSGLPLGYWAAIPISHDSFTRFLSGTLSHADMMSSKCLAWSDVDPNDAYIYIVGAVVPAQERNQNAFLHQIICGHVILDMYAFGQCLMRHLQLKGVCGYPSKTAGLGLFQRAGFTHGGVFIDGDENQPAYSIDSSGLKRLGRQLNLSRPHPSASWLDADRKRFLRQLKKPSAGRRRSPGSSSR